MTAGKAEPRIGQDGSSQIVAGADVRVYIYYNIIIYTHRRVEQYESVPEICIVML